jgi:hypothetical protein
MKMSECQLPLCEEQKLPFLTATHILFLAPDRAKEKMIRGTSSLKTPYFQTG